MVKTRSETRRGVGSKRKSSAFAAASANGRSQQIQSGGGGEGQKKKTTKKNKQSAKKHKQTTRKADGHDDGRSRSPSPSPPLKDVFERNKEIMMEISAFCTVEDIVSLSRTSKTLHVAVVTNLKDWTCNRKIASASADGDIDDSDDDEDSDVDLDPDDDDDVNENNHRCCGRRLFSGYGVPDSCATCNKVKRCGECAKQVRTCPGCSTKECGGGGSCCCVVIDQNDPETMCGACVQHFCSECCDNVDIFYQCEACDEHWCEDCNPRHTAGRMYFCDACIWKCNECGRAGCDDDKVVVHSCKTCESSHCEECIQSKRGDYCEDCVTKPQE